MLRAAAGLQANVGSTRAQPQPSRRNTIVSDEMSYVPFYQRLNTSMHIPKLSIKKMLKTYTVMVSPADSYKIQQRAILPLLLPSISMLFTVRALLNAHN